MEVVLGQGKGLEAVPYKRPLKTLGWPRQASRVPAEIPQGPSCRKGPLGWTGPLGLLSSLHLTAHHGASNFGLQTSRNEELPPSLVVHFTLGWPGPKDRASSKLGFPLLQRGNFQLDMKKISLTGWFLNEMGRLSGRPSNLHG